MTEISEIPVELLLAYHTGELGPEEAEALAQRIAQDAEATATLAAWDAQDAALARLSAPIAAEPVPERLLAVLRRAEERPAPPALLPALLPSVRLPAVPWRRLAASVALLGLGLAAGWLLRGAEAPGALVAGTESLALAALSAHDTYVVEVAHPVEVAASEGAHLTGWISRRLGHEIRPPDFLAQGFVLLGGRILPSAPDAAGTAPAALFMYENGLGQRLTLYVAPQGPGVETAFRFHEEGETRSFYWTDRDLSYAIVGDIPRETLRAMATLAYQQLI